MRRSLRRTNNDLRNLQWTYGCILLSFDSEYSENRPGLSEQRSQIIFPYEPLIRELIVCTIIAQRKHILQIIALAFSTIKLIKLFLGNNPKIELDTAILCELFEWAKQLQSVSLFLCRLSPFVSYCSVKLSSKVLKPSQLHTRHKRHSGKCPR